MRSYTKTLYTLHIGDLKDVLIHVILYPISESFKYIIEYYVTLELNDAI